MGDCVSFISHYNGGVVGMDNMWKLKKIFCLHHFNYVARHRSVNENLYACKDCGKYLVHHVGIGLTYKTWKIKADEWKWD